MIISNADPKELATLIKFGKYVDDDRFKLTLIYWRFFEKLIFKEIEKANVFFQYKMMDCMRKWRLLFFITNLLKYEKKIKMRKSRVY